MGRAAQQELLLPRKLIIFNPGRRKERGEGEGLREKRRGWQRRGEDGEGGRGGKGKVSRRGAREGRAGREQAEAGDQGGTAARGGASGNGGSQPGVSGRGLDVEGARHPPPEPLWFLSQARAGGRGASMGPTPGHPAWAESSALLGIPNPGLCGAQRLGE